MIDFNASEECGYIYCDGCKSQDFFYALTEEEFYDEVLTAGWSIDHGECRCPICRKVECGVAAAGVEGGQSFVWMDRLLQLHHRRG